MRKGNTLPIYTGYFTPMDRFMLFLTFLQRRKRRKTPVPYFYSACVGASIRKHCGWAYAHKHRHFCDFAARFASSNDPHRSCCSSRTERRIDLTLSIYTAFQERLIYYYVDRQQKLEKFFSRPRHGHIVCEGIVLMRAPLRGDRPRTITTLTRTNQRRRPGFQAGGYSPLTALCTLQVFQCPCLYTQLHFAINIQKLVHGACLIIQW